MMDRRRTGRMDWNGAEEVFQGRREDALMMKWSANCGPRTKIK